jgi:hypothetical protein
MMAAIRRYRVFEQDSVPYSQVMVLMKEDVAQVKLLLVASSKKRSSLPVGDAIKSLYVASRYGQGINKQGQYIIRQG